MNRKLHNTLQRTHPKFITVPRVTASYFCSSVSRSYKGRTCGTLDSSSGRSDSHSFAVSSVTAAMANKSRGRQSKSCFPFRCLRINLHRQPTTHSKGQSAGAVHHGVRRAQRRGWIFTRRDDQPRYNSAEADVRNNHVSEESRLSQCPATKQRQMTSSYT